MPYARTTDGVRIYYEEHGPTETRRPGEGRSSRGAPAPLVLAYGIGGNTDMWGPNASGLAAGRRVVLWEPRGHARSDSPADPARYSFRRWALDLRDLLDHLGLRRAHVGGLSLGSSTIRDAAAICWRTGSSMNLGGESEQRAAYASSPRRQEINGQK